MTLKHKEMETTWNENWDGADRQRCTGTSTHTHRPTSTLVLDSQVQCSRLEMQFLNDLQKKKKKGQFGFLSVL